MFPFHNQSPQDGKSLPVKWLQNKLSAEKLLNERKEMRTITDIYNQKWAFEWAKQTKWKLDEIGVARGQSMHMPTNKQKIGVVEKRN